MSPMSWEKHGRKSGKTWEIMETPQKNQGKHGNTPKKTWENMETPKKIRENMETSWKQIWWMDRILQELGPDDGYQVIPLKTNMEPQNGPLEEEISFGNHHFQVPC